MFPAVAVALLVGLVAVPPAKASYPFVDVSTAYPYRLQIEMLARLGVVSGYQDGDDFGPGRTLTRQQFAKMVVLAMRVPVSETDACAFADVGASGPGDLYPDNYVAAAAREGIVVGTRTASATSPALFTPYAKVSVAQMVTMAGRAAGRPLAAPSADYRSVWGAFNPVHGPAARTAQYNGLLRELPLSTIDPWRPATRGEAAALLYNLMGTDPQGLNGRFLGNSDDLLRYFQDHQRSPALFTTSLDALAHLYLEYGRRFGIRADMAWAQMIHETGFGGYGGDVKPEQNNYAGIGATGGVPGNSFATPELGVIAQFAHLAWYLYPTHMDDPYCVSSTDPTQPGDPRHFVIDGKPHRGNVRTVLDLSAKWATGTEYGDALLGIDKAIPVTHGW